jgi:hypothetical protein
LVDRVRFDGWASSRRPTTLGLLGPIDKDSWAAFGASWDRLGADRYMADGGRYRRRRHAVLALADGDISLLPSRAHYQSRDYNPLNGGIARWFAQVEQATLENPVFADLLNLCIAVFEIGTTTLEIEVHQFRIEAGLSAGHPTPEGMHRDGVDWVGIFLVERKNVEAGTTQICVDGLADPAEFNLVEPLDAVFINDNRVLHGVTPITAQDAKSTGHRDVLVLTLRTVAV